MVLERVRECVVSSPVVVWGRVCGLVALAEEFLDEGTVWVVLIDFIPVKVALHIQIQGLHYSVQHIQGLHDSVQHIQGLGLHN
jgi:hypothetical protein